MCICQWSLFDNLSIIARLSACENAQRGYSFPPLTSTVVHSSVSHGRAREKVLCGGELENEREQVLHRRHSGVSGTRPAVPGLG